MSTINPYASLLLQSLYGDGNTNPFAVQQAEITSLPKNLDSLAVSKILQGEISGQNRDGTTRITTAQGDISVQLKSPLQNGSRVDIQISNATPQSREAIIQPSLASKIQPNATPIQTQAQTVAPQPQTASTQTIADVKNLQTTAHRAILSISGTDGVKILEVGQMVRLTPLPPAQQNMVAIAQNFQPVPMPNYQVTQTQLQSTTSQIIAPQITLQGAVNSSSSLTVSMDSQPTPAQPLTSPIMVESQQVNQEIKINLKNINNDLNVFSNVKNELNLSGLIARDMRVQSIVPPNLNVLSAQNIPVTPTILAHEMSAVSTGFMTAKGDPIIAFVFGGSGAAPQFFTLNYPAQNLPAGTQVTLTPLPQSSTMQPSNTGMPQWKNMGDIMNFLAGQVSAGQPNPFTQTIPNLLQPQSFPAAALLFLAAANGGDLSQWLGPKLVSMLQNSPQSIRKSLDNLANDILENSGKIVKSTDLGLPSPVQNTPADWRSHMLPLMMGGEVYKLPVWIKDNHGDNADDDNGTISTRFVVDINLSRMGDIQIDGMIRNITRRFDVSLTSERPMSEAMQGHISQLWSKTMLAIDMRGDIEFRICETQ